MFPPAISPDSIIDFSASINPLGPPSWFRQLVNRGLEAVGRYPDPECTALRRAAAGFHGVPVENVIAANGASEIIFALPRTGVFDAALDVVQVRIDRDYGGGP